MDQSAIGSEQIGSVERGSENLVPCPLPSPSPFPKGKPNISIDLYEPFRERDSRLTPGYGM
jgi:hypothetical protein